MFAQVITGGTAPEQYTGIDYIQGEELASALQQEPGFSGALSLLHRESGTAMLIVLWATREQAERALSQRGAEFRQALSRITYTSADTWPVSSAWEVDIEL
ncbi:MAG: hypothetical protein ACRDTE_00395 [Pseudonocardiaceae bacterium]